MVWSAELIKQQVPVQITVCPGKQVAEDIVRVHLRFRHLAAVRKAAVFHTALGKYQLFVRVLFPHKGNCLKMIAAVPVECHTRRILCGFFVGEHTVCALKQDFFVVVPHKNPDIRESLPLKGRSQIIADKNHFFLCFVDTGIPGLHRHRLILYGNHGNRHTSLFVFL